MNKKIAAVLILTLVIAVSAAAFTACSSSLKSIKENDGSSGAVNIEPMTSGVPSEKVYAMLFFRYYDENMLASETRIINSAADKNIETTVLEELIKGPSGNRQELSAVMPTNVRIMTTSDNQDLLFVTLSREFLDVPANIPANWENNEDLRATVMESRRLAVCSIVNTIIQLGKYHRVQILIDESGTNVGTRLPRSQLGFGGEDESMPIGPLGWQYDPILTPYNLGNTIFTNIQSRSWDELYYYIAEEDGTTISPENFTLEMQALNITLNSYEILNECVSPDGANAIVEISVKYQNAENKEVSRQNITLKFARENGVWKINLNQLLALFRN